MPVTQNQPLQHPSLPPLSVAAPMADDAVLLEFHSLAAGHSTGKLEHIFGFSDSQLAREIDSLTEDLDALKARINELNRQCARITMAGWERHRHEVAVSAALLSRCWRAIEDIVHSREEVGWYGRARQLARRAQIEHESRTALCRAQREAALREAKRLRRNENAKRRRRQPNARTVLDRRFVQAQPASSSSSPSPTASLPSPLAPSSASSSPPLSSLPSSPRLPDRI